MIKTSTKNKGLKEFSKKNGNFLYFQSKNGERFDSAICLDWINPEYNISTSDYPEGTPYESTYVFLKDDGTDPVIAKSYVCSLVIEQLERYDLETIKTDDALQYVSFSGEQCFPNWLIDENYTLHDNDYYNYYFEEIEVVRSPESINNLIDKNYYYK